MDLSKVLLSAIVKHETNFSSSSGSPAEITGEAGRGDVTSHHKATDLAALQRIRADYLTSASDGRSNNFWARFKRHSSSSNPANLLATDEDLEKARLLVERHYSTGYGQGFNGAELRRAKKLYDSSFHPDTGEKIVAFGRLSAQVPVNTVIAGALLTCRRSSALYFWHWANQCFNATVNYSNRIGGSPYTASQLAASYTTAIAASMATIFGMTRVFRLMPATINKYRQFACVAAANCVNIPLMAQKELFEGVTGYDPATGVELGKSRAAAISGTKAAVTSSIATAAATLIGVPILVQQLDRRRLIPHKRYGWSRIPIHFGLCAIVLAITTPTFNAMYPRHTQNNETALVRSDD